MLSYFAVHLAIALAHPVGRYYLVSLSVLRIRLSLLEDEDSIVTVFVLGVNSWC